MNRADAMQVLFGTNADELREVFATEYGWRMAECEHAGADPVREDVLARAMRATFDILAERQKGASQ